MKLTLKTISERVHSEADAYLFLEELRWHGTPVCPFCGHDKAYFLKPSNGRSRATGPKKTMSVRRVWKCAKCRKQFSVLTGTIFHGTKIDLKVWLQVLVQVSSAKNGMSAREVARMHEVTPETAWHMVHRIREAMKREPLASKFSATIVEADETYIGGKPRNMHGGARYGARPKGPTGNKTPVFTLIDRESGEARSQVMPRVTGAEVSAAIRANVNTISTVLMSDENSVYKRIGRTMPTHHSVNHFAGEYVRGHAHINTTEGFFSQLKRSIDGTFHAVSVEHLPRYLAEFDFRYSTCKMSDSDRALRIIDQTGGRRLAYRRPTDG